MKLVAAGPPAAANLGQFQESFGLADGTFLGLSVAVRGLTADWKLEARGHSVA